VTAEARAAAAQELSASLTEEEEEFEEQEESDRVWLVDTPRGPKELLLQDGVMLEPAVAETLRCASNATIKSAEFVKSSVDVAACPPPKYPEFAFIGRSNVGKSSLINCLTQRKALALVSKTPGKTQTINHFKVTSGNFGPWYLVDLPGYGFAKAPGELKTAWTEFTMDYFLKRESLVSVLLLVDGTLAPQAVDLEVADWLGENNVPFSVVFTKIDKRRKLRPGVRTVPGDNVRAFQGALAAGWTELPPSLMTSSASGYGRQVLLNHIAALRNLHRKRFGALKVAHASPGAKAAARSAKEAAAQPAKEPDVLPVAAEMEKEAWEEEQTDDDVTPPQGMWNARAPGEAAPPRLKPVAKKVPPPDKPPPKAAPKAGARPKAGAGAGPAVGPARGAPQKGRKPASSVGRATGAAKKR